MSTSSPAWQQSLLVLLSRALRVNGVPAIRENHVLEMATSASSRLIVNRSEFKRQIADMFSRGNEDEVVDVGGGHRFMSFIGISRLLNSLGIPIAEDFLLRASERLGLHMKSYIPPIPASAPTPPATSASSPSSVLIVPPSVSDNVFQGMPADALATICARLTEDNAKLKRELKSQKQTSTRRLQQIHRNSNSSAQGRNKRRPKRTAAAAALPLGNNHGDDSQPLPLCDSETADSQHSILLARQGSELSSVTDTSSKSTFKLSADALVIEYRTQKNVRITPEGQISLALRWSMTNAAASDVTSACLLDTSRWTVVRSTVMTSACLVTWLALDAF